MITWEELCQRLQTLQGPGKYHKCANQDRFKTIERCLKCICSISRSIHPKSHVVIFKYKAS